MELTINYTELDEIEASFTEIAQTAYYMDAINIYIAKHDITAEWKPRTHTIRYFSRTSNGDLHDLYWEWIDTPDLRPATFADFKARVKKYLQYHGMLADLLN